MRFFYALVMAMAISQAATAETPDWFSVTDVNMRDGTRGFLYQDGKLMVGKVGDSDYGHRIEIFDATGRTLLDRIEFPHSVTHIYPRGEQSVLVTGKAYTDQWYTYYTQLDWSRGSYQKSTTRINPMVQINEFGEVGGKFYFTEPGSRGVYRERSGRVTALPFEISYPSQIVDIQGAMWLLEKRGPGPGDESLVHIDLNRQQLTRVPGIEGEFGPYNLRPLGADRLVLDDRLGSRVAVYNSVKQAVDYAIDIPQVPMNVDMVGSHCAIVPTGSDKWIHVVRFGEDEGEILASYDLNGAAGAFHNSIEAEVEMDSGLLFVRSVAPCMFCNESQNGVYAIQTDLDWRAECQ